MQVLFPLAVPVMPMILSLWSDYLRFIVHGPGLEDLNYGEINIKKVWNSYYTNHVHHDM